MRFAPTDEQRGFAQTLDSLLGGAGVPALSRAWGRGDPTGGLALWRRLADVGVSALCVPESAGGLGAGAADVVIAFEELGRHLAPGPYIESVVLAPALLSASGRDHLLAPLAEGASIMTVCAPPATPFALDADVASGTLLFDDGHLSWATMDEPRRSVDSARRLFTVIPRERLSPVDSAVADTALSTAALACSAQLLGAGERLLSESVEYTKQRTQFGRAIGEYQALKHAMADVKVALDFARPLVYGAAVSAQELSAHFSRDTSAAKIAASEAAYLAARTALQMHGAIGYTEEYDLGLWITKVRALAGAWGTPAAHRAKVLTAIVDEAS